MKFNNPIYENEELAYEDVFLFQNYFDGKSRFEADVTPVSPISTNIPMVISNMNAVAGRRMAETIARYGGLCVLPQDMDLDTLRRIISSIKSSDLQYDTPITVQESHTIRDAMGLVFKRSHNCVILVDIDNKPLGIFKPKDLDGYDQFTTLGKIKKRNLIVAQEGILDEAAFNLMEENGIGALPIVNSDGTLKGIITKKDTVRNSIYKPTLDSNGKLDVSVALGINNYREKLEMTFNLGVRTFVLDTAHGHQRSMIEAIKDCRATYGDQIIIVAGNVITQDATRELINAGANGVKVGIGPGAMCTTRMKTGVGRPQFTAIYKCSQEAQKLGGFVRADGGVRDPRDFILALAAGASHVMWGTIYAGTYEAVGDIKFDEKGLMYKENYGMASRKAVIQRNLDMSRFEQERRQMFREGISTSRVYLKPGRESVGSVVDEFMSGLRSAMTYIGAKDLKEFNEKAIVGVQTTAGFVEGAPIGIFKK